MLTPGKRRGNGKGLKKEILELSHRQGRIL
jgi:hypothetical protein